VTFSEKANKLVVESKGEGANPDRIFVVDVPPATPEPTPPPADTPAPVVTPSDVPTDVPTEVPTEVPTDAPPTPDLSPAPSPVIPAGALEIASGVIVVDEAAYSPDGKWLAFSARPSDGSTGPDLYLWAVGDPTAIAVTTDHRTYFSTWLDGKVLASRVLDAAGPTAPAPTETAPTEAAPTEPAVTDEAAASPEATAAPAPIEQHPASFLLDPATLARTELAQPDMWLPVVDPTGRFVAYWSGTLIPSADGLDWQLATGKLLLDGWNDGSTPSATATPTDADETPDAGASSEPSITTAGPGPAGSPVEISTGETATFKAKFDPTGTRLAVWVGEQLDATVGRLHLIALDPETGAVQPDVAPLPGAPALRRFSIDVGRLAWVTPSGQDGEESTVQVLGWSKDNFGEIRTVPARDLFLIR
jgi:hypothetical protein